VLLGLIPALGTALLWVVLYQRFADWRQALLRAMLLGSLFTIAMVEILSLFSTVKRTYLLVAWLVLSATLIVFLLRRWRQEGNLLRPRLRLPTGLWERLLLAGCATAAAVTLIVALRTPPQTWDSLNYHMSRVAHWAQMGAVQPYATGIEVQNSMPPGPGMLVLQLYVLAGSDALVNLVGWSAVMVSTVGSSLIARQFGADARGQLLASLAVLTIPMAIVQASTTMTDAVLALWLIIVASELLQFQQKDGEEPLLYVSVGAGLSILSKQTAFAFLLPLAVAAGVMVWRKCTAKRILVWVLMAVLIVGILNAGMFTRNAALYGNPIGPLERFGQHANSLMTPGGLLSNLVRNLTLHLGTPSPYPNKALALSVIGLHDLLGLDVNDPRTTAFSEYKVRLTSTHEDTAGNGLHLVLILAFLIALTVRWKAWPDGVRWMSLAAIAGYLLFSLLYKWLMFGSRLQLPFFILFAPLLGWWLSRWKPATARFASVVLFLASFPWLFSLDSRPLVPIAERSFVGSILAESRLTLTFANGPYLLDPMLEIVEPIRAAGCREVGLMLGGNSVEYPLWVLLEAQSENVEIQWIVADTPSAQFSNPAFSPCAVICEDCPEEWDSIRGLPLVDQRSVYRLFLENAEP